MNFKKDCCQSLLKNKILSAIIIVAIVCGLIGVIFNLYNTQQQKKIGLLNSQTLVTNFYSWYDGYSKENDVYTDRGYKTSDYLSADAISKLNKVIDSFGGAGGYDPIWCSRKAPDSYSIEVSTKEDNTFIVKKLYAGQALEHLVRVKKQSNIWQIDEIICEQF